MVKKNKTVASGRSEGTRDAIFVYLGPTIKGVIQNGSIYRGTRSGVLSRLAPAISVHPKIARLIIEGGEVASAKRKIKQGGNALSMAYKALAAGE